MINSSPAGDFWVELVLLEFCLGLVLGLPVFLSLLFYF